MAKARLKLVVPTIEKRTVAPPGRAKNSELRTREYLTSAEVEDLMVAARRNRHGHRDATMVRSISIAPSCTSVGPSRAPPAFTHLPVRSCEPFAGYNARARPVHSCSSASEACRSRRLGLPG